MDPDVPLVVSQVNPDDLAWHEGIIANPNCSTMQLMPPLMALRDAVGIERDGRGHLPGGRRHRPQGDRGARGAGQGPRRGPRRRSPTSTRTPIGFNALPHIDVFLDNGYTKEEWKVVTESRKILHLPDLRVSCTAVRVPVFVSHSEAVHVETRDPITPDRGPRAVRGRRRASWSRTTPPTTCTRWRWTPPGSDEVFVGRVRQDPSIPATAGLAFWVVSDNLRKGAASNAVEIAEVLVERGWVRKAQRAPRPWRQRPGDRPRDRDERRAALEQIASEVRACTRCRLHEGRTRAVPGEGDPDTEVVFVGEGPGFNEDREGRPFVGRAGGLLVRLLGAIGWQREDVFITNVVKCRPPDNRDPQPDEIAACAPFLRRQLEVLDPAVVVTLGPLLDGHVHARAPGSARSTAPPRRPTPRPAPATRSCSRCTTRRPRCARRRIERESFEDIARVPSVLVRARERRAAATPRRPAATTPPAAAPAAAADPAPTAPAPADADASLAQRSPPPIPRPTTPPS